MKPNFNKLISILHENMVIPTYIMSLILLFILHYLPNNSLFIILGTILAILNFSSFDNLGFNLVIGDREDSKKI